MQVKTTPKNDNLFAEFTYCLNAPTTEDNGHGLSCPVPTLSHNTMPILTYLLSVRPHVLRSFCVVLIVPRRDGICRDDHGYLLPSLAPSGQLQPNIYTHTARQAHTHMHTTTVHTHSLQHMLIHALMC